MIYKKKNKIEKEKLHILLCKKVKRIVIKNLIIKLHFIIFIENN